ncbi:MAG: hypothetical protein GY913_01645 [Proteobacteria bacterium]|nr:hypothetical protein [Pseudomonadota bacterium]MCP4915603.1 hypothetical protein [Pseudomonadota bacterium]
MSTFHLSTLKLHQLRYGELDADDESAARAHLDGCEHCAAILANQENNRQAFVLEPVPKAIRELAEQPAPIPFWRRWTVVGPMLALAAVLLLIPTFLTDEPTVDVTPDDPELLAKGNGILLEAWLQTDDGPMVLAQDALLNAGDRVQLKFASQGRPFVSFGGVDGSGNAEVYGTFEVSGEGIEDAPFALTLDKTPGRQRFLALFTWERPSETQVVDAIDSGTPPEGGILRALSFRKD